MFTLFSPFWPDAKSGCCHDEHALPPPVATWPSIVSPRDEGERAEGLELEGEISFIIVSKRNMAVSIAAC
jgi:hypothetical protein